MQENLFKITEFAKIASTNRKTLQYYDEIGLFSPVYVAENGYRYYSLLQLDQLALIAVLRDLGLPLREIKQYQECGSAEELGHLLETQSREIDRCMELLRHRKAMLTSVLDENRAFQQYGGKGFQVLEWEDMCFSRLLPEDRKPPFVVNYLTDGLQTGLFIGASEQFLYQKRTDGDICAPSGKYLCLYDLSAIAVLQWLTDTIETMNRYAAENGFQLDGGFYVEFNDITIAKNESHQLFPRMIRSRLLENR
ncbi:MAG: MerR family transcriptional regulator [Lachnospiraceae bacterium]|nr:MerR family transcriptional regulator [Lachnospiraceae bacterium]